MQTAVVGYVKKRTNVMQWSIFYYPPIFVHLFGEIERKEEVHNLTKGPIIIP